MKTLTHLLLAGLLGIALTGRGADKVLHFGNGAEPEDLDPHIVTGVVEHNIIVALTEGLVSEDPKTLDPVPGVAERWDISEDGRVYTFHFRETARWSNGDPVRPADFIYSARRILNPMLAAEYAYMLHVVKNAKAYNAGDIKDFAEVGFSVPDERTLRIELEAPTPYFLSLLNHFSWFPVHPPTVEKFDGFARRGTAWTRPGNHVGNGPFVLAEWSPKNRLVVRRSPTYWDASTVKLDAITFHPVENADTEERMFRANQLHRTTTVPLSKIDTYKKRNPEMLRIDPYLATYYYIFNTTRKPFDDPRVRRALALAIDREMLVERVVKGEKTPAYSFTPPGTAGYTPEAKIEGDVKLAQKLLAEAGFPGGRGFRSFTLLYNTSDTHRVIAEVIQQMWKRNLNIDCTLNNLEWKVYMDTRRRGDFDVCRAGWTGDYNDPNTFLDLFVKDSGNNHSGWVREEYDQLIFGAARATTTQERFALFQKAEAMIIADLPVLPLYYYTSVYLLSPRVQGWYPTILDHHPYKHVDIR